LKLLFDGNWQNIFTFLWNATLETDATAICLYKFWLRKFNQKLLLVEDVGSRMISILIRNSALMAVNKKNQCEYKPSISFILCEVKILTLFSYEKYCLYVCSAVRFGRYVPRAWNNTLPPWGWM